MEEAQLRARKEKFVMEAELAAANAKIKVFMWNPCIGTTTKETKIRNEYTRTIHGSI